MRHIAVFFAVLFCASMAQASFVPAKYWSFWDHSQESNRKVIDHSSWDKLLKTYVDSQHASGINRFGYGDVSRKDKKKLNNYIKQLTSLDPREYSKKQQKAYWINLYNAVVVQQVLAEYPVKRITDVDDEGKPGPWDDKVIKVQGKKLSLNDIEHRILRPLWKDHKIHFALACGGLGCPNLQPEAFVASKLKKQLKAAGREFINHPRGLQLEKGNMTVSSIFDDYRKDFAKDDKTLLKLLAYYVEDRKALYLLGFSGEMKYNQDWRLNSPES